MSLLSGHTKKSESVPLEFSFSYMKPFLRPYSSSPFCQRSTWNIGIRQIYDNFNFYSHPCMNLTLLNLFLQCDDTDNNNYNLEIGIITINRSTWYILATWWKRTWCWERMREGRGGGNRGWNSWLASLPQWTRVWANSGRYWKTGKLQSMESQRVGRDWATSLSLFTFMHWRRKWQPTPVFLPGESQGQGSLVGCRLCGRTESDTTEAI